jgi:hypothetical protein
MLIKNNKLFDKETIEIVKQFVSEEDIIKAQKEMMYEKCLARLEEIITLFKEKKFVELAKNFTFNSPAGDEMGCDNTCINFKNDIWTDETDFGEVLNYFNQYYIIQK